ncbi:MAG: polyisoprenoid-binding protein [Desulfuromonadales bacterium]|nr:polyisoprenoid-binding protein [Desulfuromonadales bacterium]
MLKKITALTIFLFFSATTIFAATYEVDPVHSQIHFTVPHLMMFKVRGEFTDYSGAVEVDDKNKIITANATIKTASIDTREQKRDDHLRSTDFLNAADYPTITFTSSRFVQDENNVTAYGKLTIRGITKDVALTGKFLGVNTDPWGNVRTGFEATTTINRHDFGLSWNKALETGGLLVGDLVEIGLEVEAIKQ